MAPASAVPPSLPPSVEEAYRRKCIQIKQRTQEVEEANDASRIRLNRIRRQVEKMRLERAFLLEQLAKRTSTNVEDSDGSLSPPPTVRSSPSPPPPAAASTLNTNKAPLSSSKHAHQPAKDADLTSSTRQPKEKPLRLKRGHRKTSLIPNASEAGGSGTQAAAGSTFISHHPGGPASPGSDAFSSQMLAGGGENGTRAEGAGKAGSSKAPNGGPSNAFKLYSADVRPELLKARSEMSKYKDEDGRVDEDMMTNDVEQELSRRWKDLPEEEREGFHKKAIALASRAPTESSRPDAHPKRSAAIDEGEDVKMTDYDSDQETQGEKPEE